MSRPLRFGSALSAIALALMATGCASPMSKRGFATTMDSSKIGLATRAQAALIAGDAIRAVEFAERAVEYTPNDAGFRLILGNSYFASGRFASAESAYRDSLSLKESQPQVVLKLALVQIAQGKTSQALAYLEAARSALDPADYGLALALAGQPHDAVAILDSAAREIGADARLRQNLALAHALAGDWTAARVIAAQDLAPDLVDARVAQWMTLATPTRASDQVAALIGVTPAAADPGQPVRLALQQKEPSRLAQIIEHIVPQAAPQPVPVEPVQAPVELAAYVPPASAQPVVADYAPPVQVEPVASAELPAYIPPADAEPAPAIVAAAPVAPKAPRVRAAAKSAPARTAGVVVQLGAFSTPKRVESAWDLYAGRHASLRDYVPTSARFASSDGPVYRLSVKGFASVGEAKTLCESLRKQGKSCFVRQIAGDSPVRFASR